MHLKLRANIAQCVYMCTYIIGNNAIVIARKYCTVCVHVHIHYWQSCIHLRAKYHCIVLLIYACMYAFVRVNLMISAALSGRGNAL